MTAQLLQQKNVRMVPSMPESDIQITVGQMLTLVQDLYDYQNDTVDRASVMEQSDWFQQMCQAVFDRPRAAKRELQKRHDRVAAFIFQYIAQLYDSDLIGEPMLRSLENRLYVLDWLMRSVIRDVQSDASRQALEALEILAVTINTRMSQANHFTALLSDIQTGVYRGRRIFTICSIVSQLTYSDLSDSAKMEQLRSALYAARIISDDELTAMDALQELAALSTRKTGLIYMELCIFRDSFPASLFVDTIERYHFQDAAGGMSWENDVKLKRILRNYALGPDVTFSFSAMFEGFIENKRLSLTDAEGVQDDMEAEPRPTGTVSGIDVQDEVTEAIIRNTRDPRMKRAEELYVQCKFKDALSIFLELAESGDGRAMYFLGKYAKKSEYGVRLEEQADWWQRGAACGDPLALLNLGYDMMGADPAGSKQFAEIVPTVRAMAEIGDIIAQDELADCYYYGCGVEENEQEAVRWYRRAAEQGYAPAQCNLGFCYEAGSGVAQDKALAAVWYGKSAAQGFAKAQYKLGNCYFYGEGLEEDTDEAFRWFEQAARQDYAPAQCSLGLCYETGSGVERDRSEAFDWYKKAAEQNFAEAQYDLGACYAAGKGVLKNAEKAVAWYRKAAEQGYTQAECELGFCYVQGFGVPLNYEEAVRWFRKAAGRGFAKAQYNLGYCYAQGYGVALNHREAVRWYRKSAEQGYAWAQSNLAYHYEKGLGIKQNYQLARKWYKAAIAQGNRNAVDGFCRVERILSRQEA